MLSIVGDAHTAVRQRDREEGRVACGIVGGTQEEVSIAGWRLRLAAVTQWKCLRTVRRWPCTPSRPVQLFEIREQRYRDEVAATTDTTAAAAAGRRPWTLLSPTAVRHRIHR